MFIESLICAGVQFSDLHILSQSPQSPYKVSTDIMLMFLEVWIFSQSY